MNNAETIIQLASEFFGASVEQMKLKNSVSGARKTEYVITRQVAMVALKEFTDLPLKAIGALFGNRDHATVIHAFNAIQDRQDTDRTFANKFFLFREMVIESIQGKDNFHPSQIDREFLHLLPEEKK